MKASLQASALDFAQSRKNRLDGNASPSHQSAVSHPLQADAVVRNADFSRQCRSSVQLHAG
jgi:hypothetical protein